MLSSDYMKLAVALGIVYGVYKFAPGSVAKAAAISVGAVIVAKQVPYVKDYV